MIKCSKAAAGFRGKQAYIDRWLPYPTSENSTEAIAKRFACQEDSHPIPHGFEKMVTLHGLLVSASLALSASGLAIERNAQGCSGYSKSSSTTQKEICNSETDRTGFQAIISARGTTEPQGPSIGFRTMNSNILKQKKGGNVYNVVYPAAFDQNSDLGTDDIVKKVNAVVSQNPAACIILQGYSQGASATCDALPKLAGPAFDAVKGVVLLGNPEHRPNLDCNVDLYGGKTTRSAIGFFGARSGIPSEWVSKSLDICNYVKDLQRDSIQGDGVCDTAHGIGITLQHFGYIFSVKTQTMGAKFILNKLGLDS
ncbi:hypothetical protein LLEC1_00753 [Akanthomyces lecanii]|uniref:Cutinase n=1 Tax=Cordyceps confragosa TaxID=2714763 RepID=A0A179I9D3_CORDF|nr:hypothetical protein LLEC1_00753 [Akanthomyces lecanii]